VVAPAAERRSDYDFCRDLGRRLGQTWPDVLSDVYDEWLRDRGVTFDELRAAPEWWIAPPAQRCRHEAPDPDTGEPLGFGTPSRKVELRSSVLEQLGYDGLPTYEDGGAPAAGAYPLRLMTGATRIDATHQDHRHVPRLRRRHPDPVVELDPELAGHHGIGEGDWTLIETPTGSVRQRARLVPGLGTDRVNAERWWYPEGPASHPELFGVAVSNVNAVTDDDLDLCDPAYGALPYRVARCRVALANPPEED
jgi:thiosulfate reductase/polysulfide reductase chain A